MKKVAFHTLGCKVNQYETQAMTELFEKADYTVVPDTDVADVYVINTCTVTNVGDKKSRQFIRRAKKNNPDSIIAVVGCYAQTAPKEVLDIEGVNIVVGTNERGKIVEFVEQSNPSEKINAVDDIMQVKEFEELSVQEIKGKTRAFLKIQEGCNQYCAYCIIPYARGPIRSRKISDVLKEVRTLVTNGFKEVVLTGIHVASYGKDLKEKDALINLLKEVNGVEGLERIRLSSLEPTLISEDFIKELVKLEKICQHFHLSLQSGSDSVLKKMNRRYTTDEYRQIVKRIRRYYPNIALTTDIIVGFPGETQDDFETTYRFVEEMAFSDIHVFKFSPRKGTPAADFSDQVNGVEKHHRSEKLIILGNQLKEEYQSRFIGETIEVLFENNSNELVGYVEGLTDNYLKVLVPSDEEIEGAIKRVLLEIPKKDYIIGKLI
ncbi:tRNA (N(6)-L-threonylcarbamoyladenosine(37)-C(2))-methylthiotransferase MtaB [Alkaliphilus transvaalensis]|uniref:tRNA (N(6)-L-threonylcarbamoyladenosine(37)-C(2))- methylthiotransferase MtaB n=1 Tax=Alkaliphilus transvaalensis TaxID=114628 RepID=UPI000479BE66|nr:tRNA (N(6)-L-threonylcarbamoyladenosine(37)-C(2))-methylthiotransferase MtaB [Alkaliphilus transvaalensis]